MQTEDDNEIQVNVDPSQWRKSSAVTIQMYIVSADDCISYISNQLTN